MLAFLLGVEFQVLLILNKELNETSKKQWQILFLKVKGKSEEKVALQNKCGPSKTGKGKIKAHPEGIRADRISQGNPEELLYMCSERRRNPTLQADIRSKLPY